LTTLFLAGGYGVVFEQRAVDGFPRAFLTPTTLLAVCLVGAAAADGPLPTWKHLSSKTGDWSVPNGGKQQTACVVFDIDKDGAADIVIAERTQTPASSDCATPRPAGTNT